MSKSINIFFGTLTLVAAQGCAPKQEQALGQPNVLYVFPDQFRNHAMGFWTQRDFAEHINFIADPVQTPVLDSFAREALVLTSAVSNCPLSSPHRGMLLTGAYPDVSGVSLNCNSTRPISSLRENVTAIGDVFSAAGYDCAYIGKLHVDFPTPNDPENPGQYVEQQRPVWDAYTPKERRHGFNYWYSYGTFDVHKSPHYWDTQGVRHEIKEWSPKHEADKAIAYMRNDGGERDGAKPFFMVVSMNPPHSPYNSLEDCMEQDYNLYKDMTLEQLLLRPNANREMEKAAKARYYFASVTGIDREFGRILSELKRLGLDKNTIVVFTSDHGETMCSQNTDDPKNSAYAESLNVPFMVRYPMHIAPRVDSLLISTPDIMPTLLGLCSLNDEIPASVQGRDLSHLLLDGNSTEVTRPEAALYIRNVDGKKDADGLVLDYFPVSRGVKTAQYTLALTIDRQTHKLVSTLLFDDRTDPYQLNNIPLEQAPQQTTELMRMLGGELKRANDPWYSKRILADMIPY